MNIITCQDVTICYQGREAVSHVSFSLEAGDYLCLVGENGSGKSTLMKGILGLVKLQSGSVEFHGMKRTEIGYLPQQTVVQRDFPATVGEVVLSGCLNARGMRPFYSKKEKQRAQDAIQQLGIESLQKRSYRELSGGQQQRVLLARALCATKKLLLLDEPVNGLDPVVTAELYALIRRINQEEGITILMVSHDLQGAVQQAGKILHLRKQALFFGPTEEYRTTNYYQHMTGGGSSA